MCSNVTISRSIRVRQFWLVIHIIVVDMGLISCSFSKVHILLK